MQIPMGHKRHVVFALAAILGLGTLPAGCGSGGKAGAPDAAPAPTPDGADRDGVRGEAPQDASLRNDGSAGAGGRAGLDGGATGGRGGSAGNSIGDAGPVRLDAVSAGGDAALGGSRSTGGTSGNGGSRSTGGAAADAAAIDAPLGTSDSAVDSAVACEGASNCGSGNVPAANLTLSKISVFQTVEIPLMRDGVEMKPRNADIVQGKDALLRVHVQRAAGFQPHAVTAFVQVASTAGSTRLAVVRTPTGDSSDADLASTFNVTVPGRLLTGNATYRVSLAETDDLAREGDTSHAAYPATAGALGELSSYGLSLTIVPLRYTPDGSNRLPDTSPEQIAKIRQKFLQLFPISDAGLKITVAAARDLAMTTPLKCDRSGWDDQFEANMYSVVDAYKYPRGVYFYGMVQPAASNEDYRAGGDVDGGSADGGTATCLSGIASTPWEVGGATIPIAMGISDPDTVVHEIAHTHGRRHAPCGNVTDMIDKTYPYTGGLIGSWGYDFISRKLVDPSTTADLMGYCKNEWISDYNYQGLFQWIGKHNQTQHGLVETKLWQTVAISNDGEARRGLAHRMPEPPGLVVTVEWFDKAGISLDLGTGTMTKLDNIPKDILHTLTVPTGAASFRINGGTAITLQ